MKCTFALGLTAAFVSPLIDAAALQNQNDRPPRAVGLPIKREPAIDPIEADRTRMRKRDTLEVTLGNLQSLYYANITLGTPAQHIRIQIDTGSSDLWVNSAGSKICTGTSTVSGECEESGTYSANSSSTYKYVQSNFNITYMDGSGAAGDYVSDLMMIANAEIKDLQFGVGYQSTSSEAVLGIGYVSNEVQVANLGLKAYNNVPAALAAQGTIPSNAYSLWLNDLDSHSGNILFGGVDTERFTGTLETLPVQKTSAGYTDFLITLTSLSFGGKTLIEKQAQAVLLDSGSSLIYLPNAMTNAIYEAIGAQYDSTQSAAFVPCSMRSINETLDFKFTSPTISVPLDELILDIPKTNNKTAVFPGGEPACLFGIAPSGVTVPVLGDTFLRSAYVVYDLGNNEISLAQTKFNATKTNIVELSSGKDAAGIATAVANPVAATAGVGKSAQGKSSDENAAGRGMRVSLATAGLCGVAAVFTGLM
ncbi:hypothetical protein VE02_00789 [Pseudogymnoascus sp. 03VT05]|nr:hypothetical protein VE02_00789 [Pseudogymnoascus sp. 03VT05]